MDKYEVAALVFLSLFITGIVFLTVNFLEIDVDKLQLKKVRQICNDKISEIKISKHEIKGICGGDLPFEFSIPNT